MQLWCGRTTAMKKTATQTDKSRTPHDSCVDSIREFHLFAGIGGGIYGGKLLHHQCVGAVEIMPYARGVLAQRKKDGWMDKGMDIDSHTDITKLNGEDIRGTFDVLCGGFPCQAFSTAAHGKNIAEKNLWDHMFRVVQESEAPIVFGENVVLRAIEKARCDLEGIGYRVERIRLSCEDLGADHRRNRFWLLAVRGDTKGERAFQSLSTQIATLPKLTGDCWTMSPVETGETVAVKASAFRILVNRHLKHVEGRSEHVAPEELDAVFEKRKTWIDRTYRETGIINGLVHTPTTMANYACPSMMKHEGNAEYLMGFPLGASSPDPQSLANIERWG